MLRFKNMLNEVSDKITYPLPKVEDILNKLKGATCFTMMDVRRAYLQLKVHQD